jgi:hypothetical protein
MNITKKLLPLTDRCCLWKRSKWPPSWLLAKQQYSSIGKFVPLKSLKSSVCQKFLQRWWCNSCLCRSVVRAASVKIVHVTRRLGWRFNTRDLYLARHLTISHKVGYKQWDFIQPLFFLKDCIFWDITPCIPLKVNRRFGGTCLLHLQGRTVSQGRNRGPALLHASRLFVAWLIFHLENWGDIFLRNFDWVSTDCTALYPRR